MRKVLIVDDEKFIRKGVRVILERADTVFKEIHEAVSGKNALEILRQEEFDLVITDIRMPLMDGISLMMEASSLSKGPKFIILSGYDDFNYARDAIKYGVKEYLLKPVKREELLEAVRRIEAELEREEKIDRGSEQLTAMINHFREHELNFLLQNASLSEEEALNIADTIHEDLLKGRFHISVVLRLDSNGNGQGGNKDLQTRILVNKYFEKTNTPFLCFQTLKEELVLVTENETDYAGLIRYLNEGTGGEHCIGTGREGAGPGDLSRGYVQACEALRYRVVRPVDRAIGYDEICDLNAKYQVPVDLIKKIALVAGTARREELEALFKQVFHEQAIHMNRIEYMLQIVEGFNTHVNEHFKALIPQKARALDEQYACLKDLYNFRNIREYMHVLRDYILEINDFMLALQDTYKETYEIDAAIAYMKENYQKDLTMAMVANHVSLNYTYFSILFSQRTGKSFIQFLKELRIEKARELLRDTGLKINEVSEKSGFKNPKHFTRVFKETTGISPIEYKNKPVR